jgi:hypothetical protein
MNLRDDWKTKIFLIGGVAGLVTGLLSAFIFIQQAERRNRQPEVSASEGVKIGLNVLTLLRAISDIANR